MLISLFEVTLFLLHAHFQVYLYGLKFWQSYNAVRENVEYGESNERQKNYLPRKNSKFHYPLMMKPEVGVFHVVLFFSTFDCKLLL